VAKFHRISQKLTLAADDHVLQIGDVQILLTKPARRWSAVVTPWIVPSFGRVCQGFRSERLMQLLPIECSQR